MPADLLISLPFVLFVSFVIYTSDRYCLACMKHGQKIISFLIGAMVVNMFVELLDNIYTRIHMTENLLVLFIPLGFLIMLGVDKHRDAEVKEMSEKRIKLAQTAHKITGFVNSFFIGALMVNTTFNSQLEALIFYSFLAIYVAVSKISLHLFHHYEGERTPFQHIKKVLLSLAPLFGLTIAYFFPIPILISTSILAFISGAVLSIIIREILPEHKRTIPHYFFSGAAFLTILVIVDHLIHL